MNILIVYASKSGTCCECAEMLRDRLPLHNVTLADITKSGSTLPSPSDYDLTIVGGPIRFGKLYKNVRSFIKTNESILANSRAAYFICCGFIDQYDIYLEKAIPKQLYEGAVSVELFGGRLKPANAHGLDKLALKIARNSIISQDEDLAERDGEYMRVLPEIIPENITKMAEIITGVRPR